MSELPSREAEDMLADGKSRRRPSHVAEDLFRSIDRALHYRFWWKGRERSNHAVKLGKEGPLRPSCSHSRIAWSGPPHDKIQAVTCLDCQSYATEPEMMDMGFNFNDCPDWIFFSIMDARSRRVWLQGNPKSFYLTQK